MQVAQDVAALFKAAAADLRVRGEHAKASVNPLPSGQVVVALEVVRDGGDWQRNLVMTLDPVGSPQVDVRLLNDDQDTIEEIGEAGDAAMSLGRAGIARLLAEV